jgi:hypothetical protein
LFEDGLKLVDPESREKIKKFYRQEDAWRMDLTSAGSLED